MKLKYMNNGFLEGGAMLTFDMQYNEVIGISDLICDKLRTDYRRYCNVTAHLELDHMTNYLNVDEMDDKIHWRRISYSSPNLKKFSIINDRFKIFGYTSDIEYDADTVEVFYLVQAIFVL